MNGSEFVALYVPYGIKNVKTKAGTHWRPNQGGPIPD